MKEIYCCWTQNVALCPNSICFWFLICNLIRNFNSCKSVWYLWFNFSVLYLIIASLKALNLKKKCYFSLLRRKVYETCTKEIQYNEITSSQLINIVLIFFSGKELLRSKNYPRRITILWGYYSFCLTLFFC